MKNNACGYILVLFILASTCPAQAQLASEKPMNKIYAPRVQAKLDAPKTHTAQNHPLPSQAGLPKEVTEARSRMANKKQTAPLSDEEKKKKLPSNSKKRIPEYKRPKHP